jgi:hypothetical protein
MKNPAKAERILLKIGYVKLANGLIKNDNPKEIQKLLHSWQSNGFLIYGILATKFLKGLEASVSDQP